MALEALGEPPGQELPQVLTSVLAQAQVGTDEATETLARLLGEELPPGAKQDVATSLALVDSPTEETTGALLKALDEAHVPRRVRQQRPTEGLPVP